MKKDFCIVIPAYNPDGNLTKLINDLQGYDIIVVNDGSTNTFDFNMEGITLLEHKKNEGKGAALKTAFKYISEQASYKYVITADADGQHSIGDIKAVAACLCEGSFVLGCRNFDTNTPIRSLIGNKITSVFLKFFYNINISDSQTGLRGFSTNFLEELINIEGSGYEYETAVLLNLKKSNLSVIEQPVSAIYCDNNRCSHFNPIKDSAKIFFEIIRRKLC